MRLTDSSKWDQVWRPGSAACLPLRIKTVARTKRSQESVWGDVDVHEILPDIPMRTFKMERSMVNFDVGHYQMREPGGNWTSFPRTETIRSTMKDHKLRNTSLSCIAPCAARTHVSPGSAPIVGNTAGRCHRSNEGVRKQEHHCGERWGRCNRICLCSRWWPCTLRVIEKEKPSETIEPTGDLVHHTSDLLFLGLASKDSYPSSALNRVNFLPSSLAPMGPSWCSVCCVPRIWSLLHGWGRELLLRLSYVGRSEHVLRAQNKHEMASEERPCTANGVYDKIHKSINQW